MLMRHVPVLVTYVYTGGGGAGQIAVLGGTDCGRGAKCGGCCMLLHDMVNKTKD